MGCQDKKEKQLGMPIGTAASRLRKIVMFDLVKQLNKGYCYKCGNKITDVEDFSIEHKIPWLDSEKPIKVYFDLDNIAFSHRSCNVGSRRNKSTSHNSSTMYTKYKCRCNKCLLYRKNRYKEKGN